MGRSSIIFARVNRDVVGSFFTADWEREGSHEELTLNLSSFMVPRILQTSSRESWMYVTWEVTPNGSKLSS
jgi:hypothetical protein